MVLTNFVLLLLWCHIPIHIYIVYSLNVLFFFLEWLTEYKSVTVTMDWFMDCLFRYKFVFIEFKYQAMKLNNALIHYSDMDGSMFQLNEV